MRTVDPYLRLIGEELRIEFSNRDGLPLTHSADAREEYSSPSLVIMYSTSSSSSKGFPVATISSPSDFILAKYSTQVLVPFWVVEKARRRFTALARVREAYISSISCHASAAVVLVDLDQHFLGKR